jgi:hypothetical protein
VIAPLLALLVAACSGTSGSGTPSLTEEYGCGHGFYLGNANQDAGLFIVSDAGFGEEVSERSVSLPDEGWGAELRFGTDLFANWCDDVLEPGEPEPSVDETWPVSGSLEITELPRPGECGLATATLRGAGARSPEGDLRALGDLDLRNETWGCFAG